MFGRKNIDISLTGLILRNPRKLVLIVVYDDDGVYEYARMITDPAEYVSDAEKVIKSDKHFGKFINWYMAEDSSKFLFEYNNGVQLFVRDKIKGFDLKCSYHVLEKNDGVERLIKYPCFNAGTRVYS